MLMGCPQRQECTTRKHVQRTIGAVRTTSGDRDQRAVVAERGPASCAIVMMSSTINQGYMGTR